MGLWLEEVSTGMCMFSMLSNYFGEAITSDTSDHGATVGRALDQRFVQGGRRIVHISLTS